MFPFRLCKREIVLVLDLAIISIFGFALIKEQHATISWKTAPSVLFNFIYVSIKCQSHVKKLFSLLFWLINKSSVSFNPQIRIKIVH